MSLRSDDLDSVGELYTEDEFRQLVVAIEASPASLGGLDPGNFHRCYRVREENSSEGEDDDLGTFQELMLIPNISRSVADRSRSGRAGVPPMAPTTVIGTACPRVGGWLRRKPLLQGEFF